MESLRKALKEYNKKGLTLQDAAPVAIIMVVLAIVLSVGGTILTTMSASGSVNQTIIDEGSAALATFADWQSIIAIVVVAALVIGIIYGVFMKNR